MSGLSPDSLLRSNTLPDASFDLVVLCLGMRHIVAPPKHYSEVVAGAVATANGADAAAGSGGGDGVAAAAAKTADPTGTAARYLTMFRGISRLLVRGGHFIAADHCGHLSVFDHLRLLDAAGFFEVECAWKQQDFFVIGGRKRIGM